MGQLINLKLATHLSHMGINDIGERYFEFLSIFFGYSQGELFFDQFFYSRGIESCQKLRV